MKPFILLISIASLFIISCKKESVNKIKPVIATPIKSNRIINTYKHPYYERYVNYRDNLNSLYINHQNKKNQEGC